MSFGTALALLVGLLVAAPIVAHLLRRGKTKTQEFPPAHLVPTIVVTSEQRSRLEDRVLLSMRALMVLALAVLGATPFVTCERLSVDRPSGASVAMAIVIDDSQSMRARTSNGRSRFEQAITGAEQLLGSARQGDAIAFILAGKPARLLLSPTPELDAARSALASVEISDRPTDLEEAIALARSSLKDLPHVDKRVVLLSDLATERLPEGEPELWTPLPDLSEQVDNCGIASAQRQGRGVTVKVGCSTGKAATGRQLKLHLAAETDGEPLASLELKSVAGEQELRINDAAMGMELAVAISGSDAIERDNQARVARELGELVVAVIADPSKASAITGGPTLLEQALGALDPSLTLKPLGSLPVAAEDLAGYAALVVDDPPGLSPESRTALTEWVERGGVALGLLGPSAASAQLAASAEPFARKGALWEQTTTSINLDVESVGWLGNEARSLADIDARGRVRLDAADLPGATIAGNWTDGVPWLFRRELARGLILTVGLPASIEHSDFSLRPGFLALLEATLEQARLRTGPRRSVAGSPWHFPSDAELAIEGPTGPLVLSPSAGGSKAQTLVFPTLTGSYDVEVEGKKETRLVVLDAEELIQPPLDKDSPEARATTGAAGHEIDASPEWALLVLALLALELLVRVFGDQLKRRLRRA